MTASKRKMMLTINDLDDRKDIENVVLNDLKPRRPDTFRVCFWFRAPNPYDYKPELLVVDDFNDDFMVFFDENVPESYIPRFLIDSDIFLGLVRMSIEDAYGWAMAMAVMATTKVKVKFQRKKDEVVVLLSIGAFFTKKRMPIETVKSIFELVEE